MEQKKCEDCKNKSICMYKEDLETLVSELKTNSTHDIFVIHCRYFAGEYSQFR